MTSVIEELRTSLQTVHECGGDRAVERHTGRGKLLVRDRIDHLLAPWSGGDGDAPRRRARGMWPTSSLLAAARLVGTRRPRRKVAAARVEHERRERPSHLLHNLLALALDQPGPPRIRVLVALRVNWACPPVIVASILLLFLVPSSSKKDKV